MNIAARSAVHRYVCAVAAVGAAILLRVALGPWLGAAPYIQFFPAIVVASWYGGLGPGLIATGLSAAAAAHWIITPGQPFKVFTSGDALGMVMFLVIGAVIAWLNEGLRRSAARHRDVADRLRIEYSALADLAQSQLAAIVESSDDAIISKNLNGIITSWNRAAERLFGYAASDAVGQHISLIIPSERRSEDDTVMASIRAGQHVPSFETVRIRKDGTRVDVAVTESPIRGPSGAIVGASKIARDITDRRRSDRLREELLERERQAREEAIVGRDRFGFLAEVSALLTSSLDYTATLDRAVHLAVPRLGDYCTVLVQDEAGLLHYAASAHVIPEKEPMLLALVKQLLENPATSFSAEVMAKGDTILVPRVMDSPRARAVDTSDPRVTQVMQQFLPRSYVGMPLLARGRPAGVLSFGTTVQESGREYTERDLPMMEEFARRVSLAIDNARLFQQAEQLNRLKDEFLATVSHELRTPLSAILGWARLLASGELPLDKRHRAVEAIERNAQAQARLVDDILDVARGMSGNIRLEVKKVDLVTVAHRGVDAIAPAAAAKNIHVDITAPAPVLVNADAARLQQVVWNLLSNAVKFTPTGGHVSLDVHTHDAVAELRVTDTGSGISASFLPFVFDKFRQEDGSFTRQHGGLGLGLAIARHLIELHGGSIEARSEGEGRGATFCVTLPLAGK